MEAGKAKLAMELSSRAEAAGGDGEGEGDEVEEDPPAEPGAEDGGGDGTEDEDEAEKRARETARVMTAVVFATVVSEGGGRVRTFAPRDDAKVGRRGVSFSQRRTLRVDVGHRFAMRPLGGVRHVVHAFTSVIALRVEHSRTVARSDDLMLTNKG